jgi:hypothetical protein
MDPPDLHRSMGREARPAQRRRTLRPDYVLAAVLIWSMILYGLLAPRAPAADRLAARSAPVCVR